jgi:formamidopyrimidine-DNA glycosylase
MPELPEVVTLARYLREGRAGQERGICGLHFKECGLEWQRSLAEPEPAELNRRLCGQQITAIGTRGKFIWFSLSSDHLIFHLRMSGDLFYTSGLDRTASGQKHIRFWASFEEGGWLVFNDPRKFGRIWLVSDPDTVFSRIGMEPFDDRLTPEAFHRLITARRRQLKPLLLDQSVIAGLGNIYTDEALFLAKLHPLRDSAYLNRDETNRLLLSIREALREGIRRNGASIDWVYRGGDFQNHFNVYQQTGKPCPVCGTPIERIRVGQRGTHFCPFCQKMDISAFSEDRTE